MRRSDRIPGAPAGALRPLGIAVALGVFAAACGGGGGGGGSPDGTAPGATTRVSGSVYAGPVAGSSVVVTDAAGAVIAGPTVTAADGTYAIDLPAAAAAGALTFEATGGTFTDEATGARTDAGRLAAHLSAPSSAEILGAAPAVHLTPGSTLVANLVTRHGVAATRARTAVGAALGFTPDPAVAPVNAPAAEADPASRLAGLRAAAFSQLARDLGLPPADQFALVEALAADLADGTLDGGDGDGPVSVGPAPLPEDVQNRFERALLGFLGSTRDRTGLDAGQVGFLPFARVALTGRHRVEYVPLDPGAALGETPFELHVTVRDTGAPAAGLALSLEPVMHMDAGVSHGTPIGAVVDRGDGSYAATIYYSMAGGDPWGYWSLDVGLGGGEAVTFHPAVGDPSYATLWGQEDRSADGLKRAWYLFDAGLAPDDPVLGTYRFDLFVVAREDDWRFPPLAVGTRLQGEDGGEWGVTSAVVEVSLDGVAWHAADPAGPAAPGRWSAAGLAGIDPNSEELTLYVRLTVDGEVKTRDGGPVAADGSNGYAELASGGASCCR